MTELLMSDDAIREMLHLPSAAVLCPLCPKELPRGAASNGVCDEHAFVVHVPTLTAGAVVRVHPPGAYRSKDEDARPVTVAVIELDTGDAFIVDPASFVGVPSEARELHDRIASAVTLVVGTAIRLSKAQLEAALGPAEAMPVAALLTRAALTAQIRRLAPREEPGG